MLSNRWAVSIVLGGVALVSAGVVSAVWYSQASKVQIELAEDLLLSEMSAHRARIVDYLTAVENLLVSAARGPILRESLKQFLVAYDELGEDGGEALRQIFIHENPNPRGLRHALLGGPEASRYSRLHRELHPWLREITSKNRYRDLVLVSPAGEVIYSVHKEDDFGARLEAVPHRDEALGRLFRRLSEAPRPEVVLGEDFEPYAAGGSEPAAFLGTAVFDEGEFIGVLAIHLKTDPFDALALHSTLMGETGDTFLIGSEREFLTPSRFQSPGESADRIESASVEAGREQRSGVHRITNQRDRVVLSAFGPVAWRGLDWVVIAEMEIAEIKAPVHRIGAVVLLVLAGLVLGAAGLGFLIADPDASDRQ